ncbi:MAG: EamA family transporter [Bdellovibrionota bacterium]
MHTSETKLSTLIYHYLMVYIGWGTTFLALRNTVLDMPVTVGAAIRYSIAASLILMIKVLSGHSITFTRNQLLGASFTGLLMFGVAINLEATAMKELSSGIVCIIAASAPFGMALFNRLLGGKPITASELVGGIVAMSGVIFLAINQTEGQLQVERWGAFILCMGGMVFWSLGSVLNRHVPVPSDTRVLSALQLAAAGVFMALVAFANGDLEKVSAESFSSRFIFGTAYLVVLGGLLVIQSYNWLVKNQSVAKASSHAFVNPMIAVFVGYFLGGESLNAAILLSLLVVLVGTALMLFGWSGLINLCVRKTGGR